MGKCKFDVNWLTKKRHWDTMYLTGVQRKVNMSFSPKCAWTHGTCHKGWMEHFAKKQIDILVWSGQWTHLKTVFNTTVSII